MLKTIIIGIVITIVSLFALSAMSKATTYIPSASSSDYSTVEVSVDSTTTKVTITGAVSHTGSYYIDPEETLGSLITMAGGALDTADSTAYNESVIIGSRTSFYIAAVLSTNEACLEILGSKTNVNTAEKDALTEIGMNSSQAAALIEYREDNGDFEVIEDIENVKGIGTATFEKVKDKICLTD